MTLRRNGFVLFLVLLWMVKTMTAQDCILPVLTNFSDPSTQGFTIHWVDNNPVIASYEIEFGPRGFIRTREPDITDLQVTEYTFDGLDSGTAYELYIRSICSVGDTSFWNGPYFYNTSIENDGVCDLELPINDNNCPLGQDFLISVEGYQDRILGEDIILEKVKVIIDHPWPPDLELILETPGGIPILLSQFNGSGVDHYGNPASVDCSESLVFSDNACLFVDELVPPLIGDVRPETPLALVFLMVRAQTDIWRLYLCVIEPTTIFGELKGIELDLF